ncbi:Transcription factor TFIIIB component B, partial [Ascosphaera atra]
AQQQDAAPVVPSVETTGPEDFPEERPAKRARVEQAGPAPTTIPAPQSVAEPASATPQQSSSGGIQVVIPTRPPAQARAAAPKKPATTRRAPQQRRQPRVRTAAATEGGDGTTTPSGRPRGRRRAATPENAADIEVEPGVVKMSDICKDPRTGRTSKREMELRKLDQKKKEEGNAVTTSTETETGTPKDGEAAAEGARRAKEGERNGQENEDRPSSSGAGPGFRIVNGEIVIDNESLQIDRQADAARDAGELEEVVESDLTRRINYASFAKRTKAESWDETLTDLFYRGLRMFGTDFMMISKMFPGRNRRQIKLKFSNEERKNPLRIKETLLGPREVVSLEDYSEMTRTVYEDPKVVQAELDEERRRIEEDHRKERVAREENLRQSGADKAVPSVEGRGRGAAALRA